MTDERNVMRIAQNSHVFGITQIRAYLMNHVIQSNILSVQAHIVHLQ